MAQIKEIWTHYERYKVIKLLYKNVFIIKNFLKYLNLNIDNKDHGGYILAGMWGFKNYQNRELSNEIFQKILNKDIAMRYANMSKGTDQLFLVSYLYDRIRSYSIVHDSYLCKMFKDSEPWPTQRKGSCFVGSVLECDEFNSNNLPDCPLECRLNLNWTKC